MPELAALEGWLAGHLDRERAPSAFGLEAIEALLARLGAPQRAFPVVQVAGTKGKGTTSAAVASVLDAAGLKVGLYTSPHLVDLRERLASARASSPPPTIARPDVRPTAATVRDWVRGAQAPAGSTLTALQNYRQR